MSSSAAPSILSVLWVLCDSALLSTLFGKFRRTVLRRTVLRRTVLRRTVLRRTVLRRTVLRCTVLSHTVHHRTVLRRSVLYISSTIDVGKWYKTLDQWRLLNGKKICYWPKSWKISLSKYLFLHNMYEYWLCGFFRYILPLYDHPLVCDWAKILSKIGWKFAAFWTIQKRARACVQSPSFILNPQKFRGLISITICCTSSCSRIVVKVHLFRTYLC